MEGQAVCFFFLPILKHKTVVVFDVSIQRLGEVFMRWTRWTAWIRGLRLCRQQAELGI